MNELDLLEKELTNLIKNSNKLNESNLIFIEEISNKLNLIKSNLNLNLINNSRLNMNLKDLNNFILTSNENISILQLNSNQNLNKLNKLIEKKFSSEPLVSLFPPPTSTVPSSSTTNNISSPFSLPPPTSLTPLPLLSIPFSSPTTIKSLNSTIALHLARLNLLEPLEIFLKESNTISPDSNLLEGLKLLFLILNELDKGICTKALEWLLNIKLKNEEKEEEEEGVKIDESNELEFLLRKEEFIRLLLVNPTTTTTTNSSLQEISQTALLYGGIHFRSLLTPTRDSIISSLLTSPLYLPLSRLLTSPYASIFLPYTSTSTSNNNNNSSNNELKSTFTLEYLKYLNLPIESPLSVVTNLGANEALGKILKVSKVMKDRKTEWSSRDELNVEIPLPISKKFHSIFICPVSKEQSTELNPPMLLSCGHVIVKESLIRLSKGSASVKCPYCPTASRVNSAVRLYF